MFVLIAGGGRTGTQLAYTLLDQQHQVRVIEHRPDILARIHRELPTEVIFEGNATDVEVLDQAGIRQANILAACMAEDEENLIICYLAREKFNIPRTIARINNPRNAWLFDQKFRVDVALNQSALMASLIEEEMSLGDMMTLLKLRRGDYSLVEEKIPVGAIAVDKALKDLGLNESCVIAAIIRQGRVVVPRGSIVLQAGDEVLAITDRSGLEQLQSLFSAPTNNHVQE
ncbi:MAG: TrkA family potassium uptake protein [Anaerolineales bacterium]|nr:TrkA family potassium uptake protein [Anaerolineales bacterium]